MSEFNYVSKLAQTYPTSGIRAMFDLAKDYPGAVNTCNGEPNFETPGHIKESGMKAIAAGMTKYGTEPGLDTMREAVANKYNREFGGYDYDNSNVMITIGGVEGILLCLLAILNPGDEVIIPDPTYTCYLGQTLTLGGVPVRVPLYEEHGFRLQAEDLEKAITPKTKAVIISYPSNPLGAVLSKEDGEKLAKVIEKHNIMVISDEVYEKIIFDGRKHFSLSQIPSIRDKVLVVNSLSKTYAMTGWRLGYVVSTNKDVMRYMFKMQQAVASCLPLFVMQAGADAINGPQDCVEEMRRHYERRRDLLVNGLSEIPGMKCFKTEGSFCTFINIKDFNMSSWEFSRNLLIKAGVMTVAGSAFGDMGEGYLRMCFANSDENIEEAVRRIKNYLVKGINHKY
ncbi:pyridoxal phosphate-dependent aminotransferase [Sinanaerobacter chloroacetimidivorans]|jgi:aminotransferase|uniref:Aminotransferase n=1 Tax=Sinanaerobacter chloroacetimidivorans TaxID=2818044 RepID=A0A8J7VZ54_9FIRM|nr:pyridoxal phosphate-dependent aminotransferase [Sinanaerobacter chloroacetimidivorans]MBR0597807.1 pyridoxal phosphate-dependent aminotransferase [Sinanaerobacter chloroacetimidivorans]